MSALLKLPAKNAGQAGLADVAARLPAFLSRTLRETAGWQADIALSSSVARFADWQRSSESLFEYQLGSACNLLIGVDIALAGRLLERQLGGAGASSPASTPAECRASTAIAQSMANGISTALAEAWPGAVKPRVSQASEASQFARADDEVAVITIILAPFGEIRIAFAAEGMARLNNAPTPPRIADWTERLRDSAMAARLPLRAVLARPQLQAAAVLRLAVGDILPIAKPALVSFYTGEHRLATGSLNEVDGGTIVHIQTLELMTHD